MKINLLPYQDAQRTGPNWQLIFSVLGLVLLGGVTVIFYLALEGQVQSIEAEIAATRADYQKYAAALERKALLDQLQQTYSQKSGFIERLSGEGVRWNLVMDELARIIPRTVILDTVTNDGVKSISINGRAGSLQAISQFMVNIQAAVYLAKPDIHQATWNADISSFVFSITCEAKGGDAGG
jgi:Tfp pilus assembly protein PilN